MKQATSEVRYGRKKKKKLIDTCGVQEPVRKSLLDVVEANFLAANRVIYVHRIVYVGEHSFPEAGLAIEEIIRSTVSEVNSGYVEERLTGFLLYYKKYFCSVFEGSEDALYKQLDLSMGSEEYEQYFVKVKVMEIVHHVKERLLNDFYCYTGTPAKLLDTLDPYGPLEDCRTHVYGAIQKMYLLCYQYNKAQEHAKQRAKEKRRAAEDEEDFGEESDSENTLDDATAEVSLYGRRSTFMSGSTFAFDPYRDYLLEIGRMEFLIKTHYLRDASYSFRFRQKLRHADFYADAVWPIQCDFVPYDVFDKPYEPVVELPKYKQEEVAETDGESVAVSGEEAVDAAVTGQINDQMI